MSIPPQRKLRIVIAVGTARLSLLVAEYFHSLGHLVSTISRFPRPQPWEAVHWDGETVGEWASTLELADAVINLSGRASEVLGSAIAKCDHPPSVWLNSEAASASNTKLIVVQCGPVMHPAIGPLPLLLWLVSKGFGGDIGNGQSFVSWIHDLDVLRAIEFIIEQPALFSQVDLVAPRAIQNHEFMLALREAWSAHHFGLRTPEPLVKLLHPKLLSVAAPSAPVALLDAGFKFGFPDWRDAAEELVQRWRIK